MFFIYISVWVVLSHNIQILTADKDLDSFQHYDNSLFHTAAILKSKWGLAG